MEAFSTMAMTDALCDLRLESAGTAEEIDEVIEAAAKTISELLGEYVVDVSATTEQLIDQARVDNDGCRTARRIATTLNGVGDPVQALPAARVVLGNEGFIRSEQLDE